MERFMYFIERSPVEFKQHQYDGVEWCTKNELSISNPHGVKGGLIADEMGLGKTILMIGVILANPRPRTLVVLPSVLIDQWMSEIFRTTGHRALLYYGSKRSKIPFELLKEAPLVITSYNLIAKKKSSESASLLHKVEWSRVIFDEAHHLRNGGQRFWGAKELRSPIKWLVSGTPVQNRLKDYYNMCASFNLPATFYTDPTKKDLLASTFILKRTKRDVGIFLPPCHVSTEAVEWSCRRERNTSKQIHLSLHGSGPEDRFRNIWNARKICILPKMFHIALSSSSSKIDATLACILSRIGNGNGKLVFCQLHEEIDTILIRLLDAGVTNVATFDGRTPRGRRSEILGAGFEVLVLQIQTGCEGLNLQADFSEVYFVSPSWNPATEEQAVARCHRIGQKKEVHVFRFYMNEMKEEEHSIEEYMRDLQEKKRLISNDILCN
jgi:SNF2 family DNA or RNA helicase